MIRKEKILLLMAILIILLIVGCEKGNVQPSLQTPQNAPPKIPTPQNINLTPVYGCIEDSDCVIGRGVCGTTVYNKNWNWSNVPEDLKEWAKDELSKINGIVCATGKYAVNPRCEKEKCTADFTQG